MSDFRKPVFDPIFSSAHVEQVGHVCGGRPVLVARWKSELDSIVCEHDVDLVGSSFDECFEKGRSCFPVGLVYELNERKFARSINGNLEMQLTFRGLQFSNIDMKVANRIALELLALRFVTIDIRQARYSMALQTPVQR